MRLIRSSALVWTANVAYLLASALSGALHDHVHGPSVAEDACHHEGGHENRLTERLTERLIERPGYDDDSSPAPVPDDDCLACRFIAQCACVSLPAPEPVIAPLVVELPATAPTIFRAPPHSSSLARAPPLG